MSKSKEHYCPLTNDVEPQLEVVKPSPEKQLTFDVFAPFVVPVKKSKKVLH